jgi:hypothetical protein
MRNERTTKLSRRDVLRYGVSLATMTALSGSRGSALAEAGKSTVPSPPRI